MQSVGRGLLYNPSIRRLLAFPLAVRRRLLAVRHHSLSTVLDGLEKRVVGDVTISVPEFGGEFSLPVSSDIFRRLIANARYEDRARELFLSSILPDRDVIDVGANIGLFTVLAGSRLGEGRVLAIEPGKAAHARLRQNVTHNRVEDRVVLFRGLVGSDNGEAALNVIPGKEEYSSRRAVVHPSAAGVAPVTETVEMRKLDDLIREFGLSPAIVKIDVEGSEADVLEGAREMLLHARPKIICEYSRMLLGKSADRVLQILRECRYSCRDASFPDVEPGARDPCDLWCVPE